MKPGSERHCGEAARGDAVGDMQPATITDLLGDDRWAELFASAAAAERYLATFEPHGTILDLQAATAAGRRLFGDLLDRLGGGASQ
jgi:hypothetical protein